MEEDVYSEEEDETEEDDEEEEETEEESEDEDTVEEEEEDDKKGTKIKPKPTAAPEKGKKRSIEEEANVEDRDKETRTTKFGDGATKGRPQVVQEKQENRQVVLPCFGGKTMQNIVLSRMKTHPPPPPAPKKAAKAKSVKKTWVDLKLRVKEDGEGRPRIEKFGQGLKESQVENDMIFVGNVNYFVLS